MAHGILDELQKIVERGEAVLRTLAGNVVKEKAHAAAMQDLQIEVLERNNLHCTADGDAMVILGFLGVAMLEGGQSQGYALQASLLVDLLSRAAASSCDHANRAQQRAASVIPSTPSICSKLEYVAAPALRSCGDAQWGVFAGSPISAADSALGRGVGAITYALEFRSLESKGDGALVRDITRRLIGTASRGHTDLASDSSGYSFAAIMARRPGNRMGTATPSRKSERTVSKISSSMCTAKPLRARVQYSPVSSAEHVGAHNKPRRRKRLTAMRKQSPRQQSRFTTALRRAALRSVASCKYRGPVATPKHFASVAR